jgi:hypothetical protein
MRCRIAIGAFILTCVSTPAFGQGPGFGGGTSAGAYPPPTSFQPNNIFNRQTQPLSPYLNLFRGNDRAVNYFYGVRPGTPAGGFVGPAGQGPSMGGMRFTFFPAAESLAEPESVNGQRGGIRPTGHVSGFNNTMGYLGGLPGPAMSTLQGGGGTARPGRAVPTPRR